jgi:hypothetical protein
MLVQENKPTQFHWSLVEVVSVFTYQQNATKHILQIETLVIRFISNNLISIAKNMTDSLGNIICQVNDRYKFLYYKIDLFISLKMLTELMKYY